MVCDSLIARSNVCFAINLAAFSYFSQCKSHISKYSNAMNNNHISQFSQFLRTRARQQASWDGKHTTVIDRTILFTGANGTYCEDLSAAEVGEVCKRTRRLWVVLKNGSNTNLASRLQTCRQTTHDVKYGQITRSFWYRETVVTVRRQKYGLIPQERRLSDLGVQTP